MAIEIVDFPIKNDGSFHSYVSLPEGKCTLQLWPFTSYNWLFLWDYTFYKWGFLSTYN